MTRVQLRIAVPSALTLARVAAVIAWVWLLSHEVSPAIGNVTQGFAAYYAASYAVVRGGAADLDNDAAFATWLKRSGIDISEVYQGNVPTLALLMIPLLPFSPAVAQTIWLALDLFMLAACCWLAGQLCTLDDDVTHWWILAVFPLLAPVRETIHWGQVYLLLGLLSLIAIKGVVARRDGMSGLAVAGMLLVKPYYGVLALGVLIWQRRAKPPLLALGVTALAVIVSMPLLAAAWPNFARVEWAVNDVPWAMVPANQTLNSLLQHWFVLSPDWNPAPLIDAPWLALLLRGLLMLILAAVTLKAALKRDASWLWLPALVLMPLFAPVGETHHLMFLLWPIALGVTRLVEHFHSAQRSPHSMTRRQLLMLAAALLLLIVPWVDLRNQSLWNGWLGLLAFPRVYGALLLWGWSCDVNAPDFAVRLPRR